jgi:DNA invertase Pin-like site-specific DNA recombinase
MGDNDAARATRADHGHPFTRHAAGKDLGGRLQAFTDRRVRIAVRLIDAGEPAAQVARDMGMSRLTLYRCLDDIPTVAADTAISRRRAGTRRPVTSRDARVG